VLPLGIIADDLTGALDALAPFAARGCQSWVSVRPNIVPALSPDVIAVSTDSRFLSASAAADAVRSAAGQLKSASYFKKLDTLLRGHWAAEVESAIDVLDPELVIIAPAFPALGRTTKGGVQYIHGTPVSEVKQDLFHAPRSARIADYMKGAEVTSGFDAHFSFGGCFICDAETQSDLAQIVAAGLASGRRVLWCGASGLAEALAASIPERLRHWHPPAQQRVWIVCGTTNPATIAQLEFLGDCERVVIPETPSGYGPAIITTSPRAGSDPLAIRTQRLEEISRYFGTFHPTEFTDTVLLATGGDTAGALCIGLGLSGLDVQQLLDSAIPISVGRGGPHDGIVIATKAGSYGGPSTLADAIQFFSK
jgi:uncharacterized protein YgbK (DUF1537 family)